MRLSISDDKKLREAIKSGGQKRVMLGCGWIVHLETQTTQTETQVTVHLTRSKSPRKVGTFTGTPGACCACVADALEEFDVNAA